MSKTISLPGQLAAVERALQVQTKIASGGTVKAAGRLEPEQYQVDALRAVCATYAWLSQNAVLIKAYRALPDEARVRLVVDQP